MKFRRDSTRVGGPADRIFPAGWIFTLLIIAFFILFSSHGNGRNETADFISGIPPDDTCLTVTAVGDIMMGSTFPEGSPMPPDGGAALFADVRDVLRKGEVVFGNLEGPLLDGGRSVKCEKDPRNCYAFRTPSSYLANLVDAGFNHLSIANNHALDFGEQGRANTIRLLDSAGIRWSGPPGTWALFEVKGRKISFIAFSYDENSNNLRDSPEARRLVRKLAGESEIVLVSFHGGAEGAKHQHVPQGEETAFGEKRGRLREFARAVVDAGADLVLGHGPHVVRGMELYKGRLIAYSLGNFCTWEMFNLNGPNGLSLILEARLGPAGVFVEGRVHPVRQQKPGIPFRDSGAEILPLVKMLTLEDFSGGGLYFGEDGRLAPAGG